MSEETYRAAIAGALALEPKGPTTVVVDGAEGSRLAEQIAKAEQAGAAWIVELPHLGSELEAVAAAKEHSAFRVAAVPGSVFVTNQSLAEGKCDVLVRGGVIGYPAPAEAPAGTMPIEKAKRVTHVVKTAEERFVFGVVLIPETKDSQGDIYSHDEVRNAAHVYMEKAQALGKQHVEIVTGKLKVLESYVAPVDLEIEGEMIAKGTWLLGIRVVDDGMWEAVKSGTFTGFSIGGEAYRHREEPAAAPVQ